MTVSNTGLELQAFRLNAPKSRTKKAVSTPQTKSVVFESSDIEMEHIENGKFNILLLDDTDTELWTSSSRGGSEGRSPEGIPSSS